MPTEPVRIDESPKTSDTILLEVTTTDADGNLIDPYKLDQVTVYFLAREFTTDKTLRLDKTIEVDEGDDLVLSSYFNQATVAKTFGTDIDPAWLSTDTDMAIATKVSTGTFEITWVPEFAREGDYILCWSWTPIIAGDLMRQSVTFELASDTASNTAVPTHITDPDKYPTLLERYLPEYLKLKIAPGDLTPDILDRFNTALANGFVVLEDLANQMVDLQDANAIHERMILYLSNLFNLSLRSDDVTLWRRQIKRAIPLFKRKGTLAGLREALAQSAATLNNLTQFWQVTSSATWQEAFTVTDDQTEFELAKSVYDTSDFELYLRPNGSSTYTTLTASDYGEITYDADDAVYVLTWTGETAPTPIALVDGDIVRIVYKIGPIIDPTIEAYIRSLPLADQRDEADVTYPPKNWNVRLIEETDTMFDVICPTRHPTQPLVVWGRVRTEFPFSENIYNMEEYNGSLRDSTDPCDMDKAFLDECSCCISSMVNIDVEIENITDARVEEIENVIEEYKPFHMFVNSLTYQAGVNENVTPQQEEVEILMQLTPEDVLTNGQDIFTRVIKHGLEDSVAVRRNATATATTAATGSGSGLNDAIVLYSPGVTFDVTVSGLDTTDNLLEILSGPDGGEYKVTNPQNMIVDIVQGVPDTIGWPLNTAAFPFRLSNELFDGTVTSITEDNLFTFTDEDVDFRHNNVAPGWKIEVTAPSVVAGTYLIDETLPNDSLILASWGDLKDRSNITYQLKTDLDVSVGDPSTTGRIAVGRRGRIDGGTDFRTKYQVNVGDYIRIGGVQYEIREFIDDENFLITGWTFGSMGVTSAEVFRRLIDEAVGYLDVRGLTLDTSPTNYETGLSISNGANWLGPLLENSQFKENFLVLIGGKYHEILEIDGTTITLSTPKKMWGLSGTAVSFEIHQFTKVPVTIHGDTLSFVDRRNNDVVDIEIETMTPMSMLANLLNSDEGNMDIQSQGEGVTIEIDWKD